MCKACCCCLIFDCPAQDTGNSYVQRLLRLTGLQSHAQTLRSELHVSCMHTCLYVCYVVMHHAHNEVQTNQHIMHACMYVSLYVAYMRQLYVSILARMHVCRLCVCCLSQPILASVPVGRGVCVRNKISTCL